MTVSNSDGDAKIRDHLRQLSSRPETYVVAGVVLLALHLFVMVAGNRGILHNPLGLITGLLSLIGGIVLAFLQGGNE